MGYNLTSEGPKGGMAVKTVSEFAREVTDLVGRIRPRKIIETGTFLGTGTTAIIGAALRQHKIECPEFYSIEVHPLHFAQASDNIQKLDINVQLLHGLSVPRHLLPSKEQIREQYVAQSIDGVYVDWPEEQRAEAYYRETDINVPADDLLGKCLKRFNYAPDLVLLDSAGHMGYVEFRYVTDLLRGGCHMVLDDTNHIKHHRSVSEMKSDPRFKILVESVEKFGFCIAEFDPTNTAKT